MGLRALKSDHKVRIMESKIEMPISMRHFPSFASTSFSLRESGSSLGPTHTYKPLLWVWGPQDEWEYYDVDCLPCEAIALLNREARTAHDFGIQMVVMAYVPSFSASD
jgi:hypothetical protein